MLLPLSLRENIKLAYFRSGHMTYLNPKTLDRMKKVPGQFYTNALKDDENSKAFDWPHYPRAPGAVGLHAGDASLACRWIRRSRSSRTDPVDTVQADLAGRAEAAWTCGNGCALAPERPGIAILVIPLERVVPGSVP